MIDWEKVPKPVLWTSIVGVLIAIGYGIPDGLFTVLTSKEAKEEVQNSLIFQIIVLDAATGEVIQGAEVRIESKSGIYSEYTDQLGSIRFKLEDSHSIKTSIRKEGYKILERDVDLTINSGEPYRFRLEADI